MTNVVRRLMNCVDMYGGSSTRIQFLLASATVGNALEMTEKLLRYYF